MTLSREFRRRAGNFRDKLLYGRERKQLARAAEHARQGWILQAQGQLPQTATDAPDGTQMLVLSGEAQSQMGLWSSWSLMRFFPKGTLVLVDDGTLRPQTVARWRALIGNFRYVSADDGRAAMERHLAQFPKLASWSAQYFCGAKLGVFQSVMQDAPAVEFDTDTLSFGGVDHLSPALQDGTIKLGWCEDNRRCYAYEDSLLQGLIGDLVDISRLPEKLNAGFLCNRKFSPDQLGVLEQTLSRFETDPRTDPLRYWMHQTLIALIAADLSPRSAPIDTPPTIYRGPQRPETQMRHFVGTPDIRPRFFTEGVAAMIRDARDLGQLPQDFCREQVP